LQTERRVDGADLGESPLDPVMGIENPAGYYAALLTLRDVDREAIVARVELRYSYQELAVALGKPSADAARVAVARAVYRLAREISNAE
jgi:RNA polymerase sigma-70 factor (ECF subfamily)